MLRSLFTGLTGLRSSQLGMDVIGNNIANVNTVGFKGSRATFKELLLQTIRSASSGGTDVGGLNAMQIGLGVSLGSIDRNLTQGVPMVTNRNTDLSIEGDGYFIVSDGSTPYYTRAGNFTVDYKGYLVSPFSGYRVQGLSAVNGSIPATGNIGDIQIPYDSTMAPSATTTLSVGGNLNAGAAVSDTYTTQVNIFDSAGGDTTLTITFTKSAANQWDISLDVATGTSPITTETISFDGDTGLATGTTSFSFDWTPFGATTALTITVDCGTAGSADGLTQFGLDASAAVTDRDGYTSGTLKQFMVNEDGVFTGLFSNGEQQDIAQIYLANFNNPGGLYDMGGALFIESPNSGTAGIAAANAGANGKIVQGTLEMSNVDLAEEFTNMIITQRAYQANARVISTSEDLLNELLNLKR